jgi:hypothetical protein
MIQENRFLEKIPFFSKLFAKRRDTIFTQLKEGGSALGMLGRKAKRHWEPRIRLVQESSDNNKINYVPNAGTFNEDENLIMHNGLLIAPLSYYNFPMLELLLLNKGVHEPQEEYVFQEVLKHIPDGAVMLELGAYWSFYSMWFNSEVENANNFLIEPEDISSGITNFGLNKMKGDFTKAYISDNSSDTINGTRTVCVDDFIDEKNIEFIDVLHSDIQGYELKMLMGAERLLDSKRVGYIFISTHSNILHYQCMEYLELKGYKLVCSYDMDESYSWDGLIVFKNPDYNGLDAIDVSKRKAN